MTNPANIHRTSGGSVTEGLPKCRFRLIAPDGKRYAPFRLHPGVRLAQIVPNGEGWELEAA